MTGEEVRTARNALGWTQAQLAERAEIGIRTVRRIEAGELPTAVVANAVRVAFRRAGVVAFREPSELSSIDIAFGIAVLRGANIGTLKE